MFNNKGNLRTEYERITSTGVESWGKETKHDWGYTLILEA